MGEYRQEIGRGGVGAEPGRPTRGGTRKLGPLVMGARLAIGTCLLVGASACTDATRFQVSTVESAEVEAGSSTGAVQVVFPGFEGFDITQTRELTNNGVTRDEIESVMIDSFVLRTVSPEGATLDFISQISFYVETEGLERTRIASLSPMPDGVTTIELEVDEVELLDYVVADTMSITTELTAVPPPDDTTLEAEIVFTLDATPQAFWQAIQGSVD